MNEDVGVMNNGINWNSTSKKFTTGEKPVVYGMNRGRGRLIGSPAHVWDTGSLWLVGGMNVIALTLLCAINGFMALLWIFILGPLSLSVAGMIGSMGGKEWQRVVAGLYVIGMLIVLIVSAESFRPLR